MAVVAIHVLQHCPCMLLNPWMLSKSAISVQMCDVPICKKSHGTCTFWKCCSSTVEETKLPNIVILTRHSLTTIFIHLPCFLHLTQPCQQFPNATYCQPPLGQFLMHCINWIVASPYMPPLLLVVSPIQVQILPCQLDTLLLPADICSLVVQPGKWESTIVTVILWLGTGVYNKTCLCHVVQPTRTLPPNVSKPHTFVFMCAILPLPTPPCQAF